MERVVWRSLNETYSHIRTKRLASIEGAKQQSHRVILTLYVSLAFGTVLKADLPEALAGFPLEFLNGSSRILAGFLQGPFRVSQGVPEGFLEGSSRAPPISWDELTITYLSHFGSSFIPHLPSDRYLHTVATSCPQIDIYIHHGRIAFSV
jgi:hypothetical protein